MLSKVHEDISVGVQIIPLILRLVLHQSPLFFEGLPSLSQANTHSETLEEMASHLAILEITLPAHFAINA